MAAQPQVWQTARDPVDLRSAAVMGIVNVTPDSFWDGGLHHGVAAAVRHSASLVEAGAALLDVGGESTRPGASAVNEEEERRRVIPVVAELVREFPRVHVSIDTVKATVAEAAVDAGAAIINDVSGLRADPRIAQVAARTRAGLVLMHSRGDVETMARYDHAVYGDVVADVTAELMTAAGIARAADVDPANIVLDPGLGFAKRTEHSLALLSRLRTLVDAGYPVMVGPSRKRFTGDVSGGLPAEERLPATIAACVLAWIAGARIFRVHDAAEVRRALDMTVAVNAHAAAVEAA